MIITKKLQGFTFFGNSLFFTENGRKFVYVDNFAYVVPADYKIKEAQHFA